MIKPVFEIKSTEIKPYTYRTPFVSLDVGGKPCVEYSRQHPVYIKKLTLLNMVGRNKHGNIISYEPIEQVNRFLMSHHIVDGKGGEIRTLQARGWNPADTQYLHRIVNGEHPAAIRPRLSLLSARD